MSLGLSFMTTYCVIGVGLIGSQRLQAIQALDGNGKIYYFDPFSDKEFLNCYRILNE